MSEDREVSRKPPRLFRNFISLIGATIVAASLASILFLFLTEMLGARSKPYLGIFTYIVFPAVMIFGLVTVLAGMLIERRRRHRAGASGSSGLGTYPHIDLNDPRRRRSLMTFIVLMFVFIFVSAFGSYRAYEFTDSVVFCGQLCHAVMKPEFVAYQASPHARVKCVECHVGPGAGWYVKSKMSGAYQLYSVTFNKFPRPIPTPVHDLRPAQDTCEQCHWPEKFFGAQLKIFNRFGYDEKNTLNQTRMLINTGGGGASSGRVEGIHWHMNIANEITYISTDDQRQTIPWVRAKDHDGNITEYKTPDFQMSAAEIESAQKRRVDCVDCHNRPAHIYLPPDRAVDEALVGGRLDASLPFLKQQAVAALTTNYETTSEAVSGIASSLGDYYARNYPDVYASKRDSVNGAIEELQRIFQTYFFPEMKVDFRTHPNNIGHFYNLGCFRCHDGNHVSDAGKKIRTDCNICHTVLDQTQGETHLAVQKGAFQHPVDVGPLSGFKCTDCHEGAGAFKHPVDLGDISQFKCTDCHSGTKAEGKKIR
ncbi:MAG: NapC/NirT family cytochrome c [Acidobacteriota bacterium]